MSNKDLTIKHLIYSIAFIGTILVSAMLFVKHLLTWLSVNSPQIIQIIGHIGEIIAYIVLICVAYFYVKTKRRPVWYVIYAICVTLIIVLAVMNFIFV